MVELFTSQGCSSCPPADAALAELTGRDDVVALAFHVDYWDYLGWKDEFADPRYTERQVSYRDAWNERVIYTPQVIVQGAETVRAISRKKLANAIRRLGVDNGGLRIERTEGGLEALLAPVRIDRPCTIWVARYKLQETVDIHRGENAGKRITYHNVVTALDRLGDWSGTEGRSMMVPQPEPGEGIAVWLQDGLGGPILAAADWEH